VASSVSLGSEGAAQAAPPATPGQTVSFSASATAILSPTRQVRDRRGLCAVGILEVGERAGDVDGDRAIDDVLRDDVLRDDVLRSARLRPSQNQRRQAHFHFF
jgi:hypothetical protein